MVPVYMEGRAFHSKSMLSNAFVRQATRETHAISVSTKNCMAFSLVQPSKRVIAIILDIVCHML